jgi:hypothetical protein
MTQAPTGPGFRSHKPNPNIYTVLAVVATIVLAIGVAYLAITNISQTSNVRQGAPNPFYIISN